MLDYLTRVVQPYLQSRKSVLIMDSHRAHFTDTVCRVMEQQQCYLQRIPGGYTSEAQMADVVMNKPIKDLYKAKWSNWMRIGTNNPSSMTKGGNRRKPAHADVVGWVNDIHNTLSINREMIAKSFVCCGLRHPSMPFMNGVQYASSLNNRLKELLYVRGHNTDRDNALLECATFAFETNGDLAKAIDSYISLYSALDSSDVVNGESSCEDPRFIIGNPQEVVRRLSFGIDRFLN